MKLQNLAIIFIVIMLPISIVLSAYTRNQIKTLNLQTSYDSKLVNSTYDAVKAFQINTLSNTSSDVASSKMRDIKASANVFFDSISNGFGLSGYNADAIRNYVPALVYTLYDGYYIYSPYTNNLGEDITLYNNSTYQNGQTVQGLKPYVYYSCRYIKGNIDVVITYTLDNYITVQGVIGGNYVNKSGYLLDNIDEITNNSVKYRNVKITKENIQERVIVNESSALNYSYVQLNGVKYYLQNDGKIFSVVNGEKIYLSDNLTEQYRNSYFNNSGNDSAINYYKNAQKFTLWVRENLGSLQYSDAKNERGESITDNDGKSVNGLNGNTLIFAKQTGKSIEDEDSNFNEHRIAVIRYAIEKNLSIAIANFNSYSNSNNEFQMPNLSETDWYRIIHHPSVISFLQGLAIGGKMYNGYAVITNDKTQEVVSEDSIFIVNGDQYSRINEKGLNNKDNLIGYFNIDFEKKLYHIGDDNYYCYPHDELGSYSSIVNQTSVESYKNIYDYLSDKPNLAKAYYTALGRERYGMYRINYDNYINN